jgi:peptidoglycan/xylan/chitin deacetylase (PgdA/CDA1 family)
MAVQEESGRPRTAGRAGQRTVSAGRIPLVLMYHSVTPYTADPYLVTVSPPRFEQQMQWLHRRGLRGVSMRELLRARGAGAGRKLVGLTFDDGYADFAGHAVPILARYGFTGTVFAIAGRLGGDNAWDTQGPRKPLMTAGQLREVAAAGMEIGSHGMQHRSLREVTGPAELAEEVDRSRELLQELTGKEVAGFCYPYGAIDERAVDRVRAAGYGYGCAIWRSVLTGRHALPRTYVGEADSWPRLRAKATRHWLRWDYRGPGGSQLRLDPELHG